MEGFPVGPLFDLRYLRLDPDDQLLESLEEYIRMTDLCDGIILSGVGSLSKSRFHVVEGDGTHPVDNRFVELAGSIEIISLQGIIADYEPHLHLCLMHNGVTMGGHLEQGCRILTMAELAIAVVSPTQLSRRRTPEITGYNYKNLRPSGNGGTQG